MTNRNAVCTGSTHLAWHVTARCNLSCPHCLRHSSAQPVSDLPTSDCQAIFDSFLDFALNSQRRASMEFSGGNPLLRPDFPLLLQQVGRAKHDGRLHSVSILGNPETLDENMVALLANNGVDRMTISVDGNEKTNNRMRGEGNFRSALKGIRLLVKAGIDTHIKFTLVRENQEQVQDVYRLAMNEGVSRVGVGHLMPAGGGYHNRDQRLSPLEYRQHMLDTWRFLLNLPPEHADFRQRNLPPDGGLYALLFHEEGIAKSILRADEGRQTPRGGHDRHVLFVVWSDGEVVLRREMARQGYVPRFSFQTIYDSSPMLHLLHDRDEMSRLARESQRMHVVCRDCPAASVCLPHMVGVFNCRPFFAPNADCWRIAQQRDERVPPPSLHHR